MLTIKKRGRRALAIVAVLAAVALSVTACAPPGHRALRKGDQLLQDGQYAEAIDQLTLATQLLASETNGAVPAKAYNFLGLALHGVGKYDEARQAYLNALKLNRNLAEADYNLGCLELQRTNLLLASGYFITYTSLRATDVSGFFQLGVTYYRMALQNPILKERLRLFENAKQAFLKSQSIFKTAQAANYIGLILIESDLQSGHAPTPNTVSSAISQFKDAVAHDSHYPPALLNLAIVYDQYAHEGKTALATYGQYLHLIPVPPHAREVAMLMTNLDQENRFKLVHAPPPSTPAPGQTPGNPSVNTNAIKQSPPPVKPSSANANPPQTPSIPANSLVPATPAPASVAASTPPAPANPQESAPANLAMTTPGANPVSASNPTPNALTQPQIVESTPPAEKSTPNKPAPANPVPVHKPSMLNPFNWFGGRAKPVPSPADDATAASADSTLKVTPLPAPQPITHYSPPTVMMYNGNRMEAERQMRVGAAAETDSRLKEAIASYQEAIKADPSYFEACQALGLVAIKAEEYATALEAFHHALAIKADSAEASYGYAWALEKKHYYQDAASELETLLAKHPDEIRAHLLLAEIYAQHLGQTAPARAQYQKVLEADPQNPQATAIRYWLQANP